MFRALVTNPPWPGDGFGARSSVRWPHKRKDKKLEYPIFLSYAVALTRAAGVETGFLDGVCDELGIEEYAAEIERLAPDFIAMECSTPSIDHDLASWPYPARDIVPIEKYQTAQYQGRNGTFMLSSRGCPYRCTFCLWPGTMVGRDFRARRPESVVDEMEHLVKRYGVDDIYFDDDTMTIDRERILEICRLIQERDLKV